MRLQQSQITGNIAQSGVSSWVKSAGRMRFEMTPAVSLAGLGPVREAS